MNHTAIVKMLDAQQDVTKHRPQRAKAVEFLNEDDELTFDVEDADKGPAAVNLQKTS